MCKICEKSHFLSIFWIYCRVEFLLGWVLTHENEKFDVFRSVLHQQWIFSFNINVILDPQILCIFRQKICGIMTFWVDFDFEVILTERMILGMWKGWCNLFSVNFIHNNSMFSLIYLKIFEKYHFHRISCVGFFIPLVNICWLDVDQILFFEKYNV